MKILVISGSLRRASHNRKLLRAAAEVAPHDLELVEWDDLKSVPPYDEEDDGDDAPEAVRRLRAAVAGVDGVLIATPEYNSSVPGQLKNALDWLSRPLATNPLRNMPAAVVGASTGAFGAVWAQAELRKVLAAIGARVVEEGVAAGHAHTKFDENGRLVDDDVREQLADVLAALADAVRARAGAIASAA